MEEDTKPQPTKKKKKNRYSEAVKKKAVQLFKDGKNPLEIVDELNGPKIKAIMRYIRKAGLQINGK